MQMVRNKHTGEVYPYTELLMRRGDFEMVADNTTENDDLQSGLDNLGAESVAVQAPKQRQRRKGK